MIAGQSIRYLPGTTVQSGGYMWGYITPDGQYCAQKSPSIPTVIAGSGELSAPIQGASFRIYPNPTNGNFTLEQNGEKISDKVIVEVYGITGERITAGSMNGYKKQEFLLSDAGYGIYFVKVVADDYAKTFKLVKTK